MRPFDFFISSEKKKQTTKQPSAPRQPSGAVNFTGNQSTAPSSSAMDVFFPKSYEEVSRIIDVLSLGKPALVNVKDLKDTTCQRVLDLLSGAIYALHGGFCELDKGIYIFSTNGVAVK